MGFGGSNRAFTHTVGYTLAGLLESVRILGAEGNELAPITLRALERVFRVGELRKRLPGAFNEGWRGEWGYRCVTGDCQLAICYLAAFELHGDMRYLNAACRLYRAAADTQAWNGAIPGSSPMWGPYMPYRWPNWAAKYFMDLAGRLATILRREMARPWPAT